MPEWRFINIDGTTDAANLPGPLPQTGDGKSHNGRGYQVIIVVRDALSWPDGLVLAVEHP